MFECSKCMQSAVNQIGLVCSNSYGASVQLEGCYLRYEHSNFLGSPDTTLMFKKCSRSVNNDVEFFKRRDDVLADLQSAIGFKVSSSGLVEGFSQCLGDLSSSDCSACLSDAVAKLKSLCGSAAAAGVYLGQCYARYWASGYYAELTPDSSHEDDVGKTVAIIVGVLAGVVVLIVLLSALCILDTCIALGCLLNTPSTPVSRDLRVPFANSYYLVRAKSVSFPCEHPLRASYCKACMYPIGGPYLSHG
ncbi:hypothetical protein Goari_013477 [Gossypium aridum]|uniref:Gnk2-homologous domain-containing protein n=1 Tax=Gossypium aridum TaxID=34290 RepID=A0A7J8XG12_GOSAI|nr:hypothetical protein [Gossypium aridum]